MIPLDQQRSGEAYKESAIAEASPISIAAPLQSASASEFLNLDLTLGDDSDGDGLPDLWEQWQLEGAGLDTGRLDLLDRDGDLDGDDLTNFQEYVAGTFAYLFGDNADLKIKEIGDDGWHQLEFLAVVDKTYAISESTDTET